VVPPDQIIVSTFGSRISPAVSIHDQLNKDEFSSSSECSLSSTTISNDLVVAVDDRTRAILPD